MDLTITVSTDPDILQRIVDRWNSRSGGSLDINGFASMILERHLGNLVDEQNDLDDKDTLSSIKALTPNQRATLINQLPSIVIKG